MIECFANTTFSYQFNLNLDSSHSWTANARIVSLDYKDIFDNSNNNISPISATLANTVTNLPNPNNFSIILSANSTQTALYSKNGVDPDERIVIIQISLTSNNGNKIQANNIYLKIKNSTI